MVKVTCYVCYNIGFTLNIKSSHYFDMKIKVTFHIKMLICTRPPFFSSLAQLFCQQYPFDLRYLLKVHPEKVNILTL